MKSAIAILTYKRLAAVQHFLETVQQTVDPAVPVGVFEDCGNDETVRWLEDISAPGHYVKHLEADYREAPGVSVFIGQRNVGVSGNSNRALRWFADSDCDHLLLCNDDLVSTGDFAKFYANAHDKTGVGLFCFSDFMDDSRKPVSVRARDGTRFNVIPRMTGIMMSITRRCFDSVGYFEADVFGKFGEEHVSWTHRARFAGELNVDGRACSCLDIPGAPLRHQDIDSTCNPATKASLDSEASISMAKAASRYPYTSPWRPFYLGPKFKVAGRSGEGTDPWALQRLGYTGLTS
jgi:GT2 family glycosyltransferase